MATEVIDNLLKFPNPKDDFSEPSKVKTFQFDNSNSPEEIYKFELKANEFSVLIEKFSNKLGEIAQLDHLKTIAIRNLIRKSNFLKIVNQLDNNEITVENFEEILEKEESKYVISLNNSIDDLKLRLISRIVNEVGMDLYTDDVEEMFSLLPGALIKISKRD